MTHTDKAGRMWVVMLPVGREADVKMGVPVGPPDTRSLGLPEHIDIALNNELVRRGLLTRDDLRGRSQELFAALQAALKIDTATIARLYRE